MHLDFRGLQHDPPGLLVAFQASCEVWKDTGDVSLASRLAWRDKGDVSLVSCEFWKDTWGRESGFMCGLEGSKGCKSGSNSSQRD